MESPDSTKKQSVFPVIWEIWSWEPTMNTMSQEKIKTTTVRMAVAKVELIFCIPIFASTAVIPAKNADPTAKQSQSMILSPPF